MRDIVVFIFGFCDFSANQPGVAWLDRQPAWRSQEVLCMCELRNFDEKQQQHNYIINAFRAGNASRGRGRMCVLLPVRQTTEDNEYDIIKSIISFMHASGTLHTSVSQATVVAASGTEGNYFRKCFTFFINIEIELIY